MTATAEKVRENRLRAAAERQGFEVRKSRRRDPRARDYGAYMIVNPGDGTIEAGGHGGMSLDDVEKWLAGNEDVLVAWALTDDEARDLGVPGQVSPTTGWVVIGGEGMHNPEPAIENFHGDVGEDMYSFDEAATDRLLEANGYRRTSPWVRGRGDGHECQVEANPRWADRPFADFCAHMRADGIDLTDGQFLAEAAMVAARPGECGNPFPVSLWAAEAPRSARVNALVELVRTATDGLPDMDPPEDGGKLPDNDPDYISYSVEQARIAREVANVFSALYDDSALEDNGAALVWPMPPVDEAAVAAQAVLEIEEHRRTARAAVELIGGRWEGSGCTLP